MRQEINSDVNSHIADHHLQRKLQIDWASATCLTYFTDYYRLTLESWLLTWNKMPLNCSQHVPALYKWLTYRSTQAQLVTTEWMDNRQLDLPYLTVQLWPTDGSKSTIDIITKLCNQVHEYDYKDNHASPTYEVTPGFIPLIVLLCMLNATAVYTKWSSTAQSCVSTKEHGYPVKWKHWVLLLLSRTLARSSSSQKTVHVLWHTANPASRSSRRVFCRPCFMSFLIALCRYQVSLQHLAGSANLPSDFASRNTSDRNAPLCVICSFILETENSA